MNSKPRNRLTSTFLAKQVGKLGMLIILGMTILTRYINPYLLRDLNPWPDTVEYVLSARNIAEHGKFVLTINEVELPSRYSVGFPLLIVPAYYIFGNQYTNGIFSVLMLDLASVALVYWIGQRVFSRTAGLSAAALVLLSPADKTLSQIIASDVPSSAFLLLTIAALIEVRPAGCDGGTREQVTLSSTRAVLFLVVSGGLFGFSCSIRQINLIYFPVFMLFLVLTFCGKCQPWQRRMQQVLVPTSLFVVGWSVFQVPIAMYNLHTFGNVTRTGYNLWAPYWYDDYRRTFSVGYAFGPTAQALVYVKAILGIPPPHPDSNGVSTLYPAATPALALLSLLVVCHECREHRGRCQLQLLRVREARDDDTLRRRFVMLAAGAILVTVCIYALYFFLRPTVLASLRTAHQHISG